MRTTVGDSPTNSNLVLYFVSFIVCNSKGSDLIFLLDSSGSINQNDPKNFDRVLNFTKAVISTLDVGFDKTRVGVISFSGNVSHEFILKKYHSKTEMLAAVDNITYMSGGTNTHLGLDEMRTNGFSAASGARNTSRGIPHVSVVMTDGQSNQPSETILAAKRVHDAGITVFAVGVTTNINVEELQTIASEPVCSHLFQLDTFLDLESLTYAIEKGVCEGCLKIDDILIIDLWLMTLLVDRYITKYHNLFLLSKRHVNYALQPTYVHDALYAYMPTRILRLSDLELL